MEEEDDEKEKEEEDEELGGMGDRFVGTSGEDDKGISSSAPNGTAAVDIVFVVVAEEATPSSDSGLAGRTHPASG